MEQATTWSSKKLIGRANTRVACIIIGGSDSDHPVDVFLNVLNQSLYDIKLSWTILNQLFNRMINLFFVNTKTIQFQEFFLFCPELSLRGYLE